MSKYNPNSPRTIRGKLFEQLTCERLALSMSHPNCYEIIRTREDWLAKIHPGIVKEQLDLLESMWGDIKLTSTINPSNHFWIECCSVKYNPTRISKRKVRNFTEQYGYDAKWYAFKWETDEEIHYVPSVTFNAWIKKATTTDQKDFYTFTKDQFLTINKRIVGTKNFVSEILLG